MLVFVQDVPCFRLSKESDSVYILPVKLTSNPNQSLIRRLSAVFMMLIMAVLLVAYVFYGRDDKLLVDTTSIPAGLRANSSANLVGYIGRVWGGDNFEFGDASELHYFFITGVDCPEPGQPFFEEAKKFLLKGYRHKILELTIDGYDDLKREFGHAIYVNEAGVSVDVGLDLIQHGMAWYDGGEFEGSEAYRKAFERAKREKIGLWAMPDAVPPWEFYAKEQADLFGE